MSIPIWQGPGSSTTTTVWSTATNWSTGAAPISADTVILGDSSVSILTGLAQGAVQPTEFRTIMDYTGLVGTSSTYLVIGGSLFNIGMPSVSGSGNGSNRMNLNLNDASAVVNVYGTGNSATDSAMTPLRLLGTTLALNLLGGTTGVAVLGSETASVATATVMSGASLVGGFGSTLTSTSIYGGKVTDYSGNAHTLVLVSSGGTYTKHGVGAVTTLTVGSRSTAYYNGTGTISTLNLTGTLDLSGGNGAVTITNANLYAGARIIDPSHRVTFTNPFVVSNCRITDVSVDLGFSRSLQVS
jgi:hypothetical protein